MRILQVFNESRGPKGGEEKIIEHILDLMDKRSIEVGLLTKSSKTLDQNFIGKFKAFYNGIYSRNSYRTINECIDNYHPDVVHVHRIYPLFSPSILVACKKKNVPVVMSVHNMFFTCPVYYHFNNGHLCERCIGGREYHCIIQNCRNNIFESIAYSIRASFARKLSLFHNNCTLFISPSLYIKRKLIEAGFQSNRVHFLPNPVAIKNIPKTIKNGDYIAFVGRISPEKGINIVLDAARMTNLPFEIAGNHFQLNELECKLPQNVKYRGYLIGNDLRNFYESSRAVLVPSLCPEAFCLVAAEALAHGKPVIASRLGALPEIVEDGKSGFLFDPSNFNDLLRKIEILWNNIELSIQMGKYGKESVSRNNNETLFADKLIEIYERAIHIHTKL